MAAYVLHLTPTHDNDAVVHFLDEDRGKCAVYVHQYKKSQKSFPHPLQLFARYELEFGPKHAAFYKLRAAYVEENYLKISEEIERYSAASCALESIDFLLPEDSVHPEICAALHLFFSALCLLNDPLHIALALTQFEARLHNIIEILPNLRYCSACAALLGAQSFFEGESFLCTSCMSGSQVLDYPFIARGVERLITHPLDRVIGKSLQAQRGELLKSIKAIRAFLFENMRNHCNRKTYKAHDYFESLVG